LNHFEEHDHHTFSFHIVRPDGQIRSVAGKAETIRSESGDPTAFFATLADTTELTQKERELQEKQAELERFTYTISHDLRSPLVTVKTFLGYLEQDLIQGDTSRISQDFEYMRTATDKMERLLEELLALSRIGRIVNAPATFTFTDLVDETLQLLAGSIAEHGVEIKIANNSGVSFYADRQRLLEIWQNLIENAIKFSSGRIPPRIAVGSTLIDGQWVFSVCDNGIGIDPRYHEKIFGLFEKLDPEGDGTGIGLAVVKRIVELYQGTIWLEASETGDGTCFRFTLPAAISYEKLRDVS